MSTRCWDLFDLLVRNNVHCGNLQFLDGFSVPLLVVSPSAHCKCTHRTFCCSNELRSRAWLNFFLSCFDESAASWKHVAVTTTLAVLDCLNLVQHLQLRCLEDRFLPQQRKKGKSLQHMISLLPAVLRLPGCSHLTVEEIHHQMHGKRRTSRFSLLKTTSSKKRHKHIQALSLSLVGPKITTSTLSSEKHCHTFHLDVPRVIPLSFTVVAEPGPACAIVIFCLSFSDAVSDGPCQNW